MTEIKSVCVYCGSHPGNQPEFTENARELGRLFAEHDIRLVYGGGTFGIMGAVAEGVRDGGGHVTGIIPQFLLEHEVGHEPNLVCNDLIITETMHERKQKMFELSDAFITLPGGIGTLEEIVEMMTWRQLERHDKPLLFLDLNDFWQPLFELLSHMEEAGFLHKAKNIKPMIAYSPPEIISIIVNNR